MFIVMLYSLVHITYILISNRVFVFVNFSSVIFLYMFIIVLFLYVCVYLSDGSYCRSFSVLVVFLRESVSIKLLLCNRVASVFASRCCWSSGIRSLLVARSLMFGVDESIVSIVFCSI